MKETNEMKEKIVGILQDDPLYAVLRGPTRRNTVYRYLLSRYYEKKFYSTPEVAGSFNITDAWLRYYVKSFEHYTTALELANKVELLSNVLQQMTQTGLFNLQLDAENSTIHITINAVSNSTKFRKEQKRIKQQIQEIEDR